MPDAADCFFRLLSWAERPVSIVVQRHNHAFVQWRRRWQRDGIVPSHILHVDEHHDMMDQRQQANIGNFMFHAMRTWPRCRVHWQVQLAIDSPAMWLEDKTWNTLTIRRAILQAYSLRGWNAKDIVGEFQWFESHKYYFQLHLLPRSFFGSFFSSKSRMKPNHKDDDKRMISCDLCGQKLRIPNRPVSLKVNCPKCGSSFVIGNDPSKI